MTEKEMLELMKQEICIRDRSWRPQARPIPPQPPSPVPLTREWGSKGKEPPSPWCSFPYFFKEIGPRPGGLRSRPFQRRWKKPPPLSAPNPEKKPRREPQLPPRSRVVCRLFYHGLTQPHEDGGHLGAGGTALGVQGGVRHPGDKLLGICLLYTSRCV